MSDWPGCLDGQGYWTGRSGKYGRCGICRFQRLWASLGEDGQVTIVIICLSGFVCNWLNPRSQGNMVTEPGAVWRGASSTCVAWLCPWACPVHFASPLHSSYIYFSLDIKVLHLDL